MKLTKNNYLQSRDENEVKAELRKNEDYQAEYDNLFTQVEDFKERLKKYYAANPIPHYNSEEEYINEQVELKFGEKLMRADTRWYAKMSKYNKMKEQLDSRVEPDEDAKKLFELVVRMVDKKLDPVKVIENALKDLKYVNAELLSYNYEKFYYNLFEAIKNHEAADSYFKPKKTNKNDE